MEVSGYRKSDIDRESAPRTIICKRKKDFETLVSRLHSTRLCMTATVHRGHICESIPGKA